jgi:Flp pilus assembly protein TadG
MGRLSVDTLDDYRKPGRRDSSAVTHNSLIREQAGQTLVEFTLIFLLFLMLLFGIAEGGRLIFNYGRVSQAAREGVRYASVRGSTCKAGGSSCTATATGIKNYVVGKAGGLLTAADVTVSWRVRQSAAMLLARLSRSKQLMPSSLCSGSFLL